MVAPFGIRPKGTLAVRMLPLAQGLVRRGYRVSIIAPPVQNPEDAGTRVVYGGVPVIHTTQTRLPGPAGVAEQVATLLQAIHHEQPDIIHLFKPKGYGGLAVLLGQMLSPGTPLVVDTDDWEGWGGWNDLLPYPRSAKSLFAWQERDLPRRAGAVTVVSRTLELQIQGLGVSPDRVFYLPNGSTTTEGSATLLASKTESISQRMVLYTRFWEFDLHYMVAVLAAIVAKQPQAQLLLIGKGERGEERTFLQLAEEAGIRSTIDYRGWAEPADIPGLLASADCALVPMENTLINRARGLAKLLELMRAGLPIVANRVGQVAEYLEHNQSALLVPPRDMAAFAGAVLSLLNDSALRQRLSDGARERAECFAWDKLAATAEQAYGRAVSSSG